MKRKIIRFFRKLQWFLNVYAWPRHTATIEVANGILSFDSKDRTLGRALYLDRNFEYDEIHRLYKFLTQECYIVEPEKGVVLDVGGYVGMISVAMLRDGLFKDAVAFEPNPRNFFHLEKNFEQNGLRGRGHAFNVGLSDQSGSMLMELSTKNYGDHRLRMSGEIGHGAYREEDRTTIEVPVRTLDDMIGSGLGVDADRISLVWMDIQGHEGKFFAGAKGFFSSHVRVPVFMEFWPYGIKRSGMNKDGFCRIVTNLFDSFYLFDGNVRELMSSDRIGEVFDRYDGPDNGCHLLFINIPKA